MPNDTTSDASQADAPGTNPPPQAGDTTSSEPQAGDDNTTISLDEAKKLRSEARSLRQREKDALAKLAAYEQKEREAQDAQLPELERLKKQVADAEDIHTGLVEQLVDREVRLQAAELGVLPQHLKYVSKLIWDELEFDADGMPSNVEALIKGVLKDLDLTGKRTTSPASAGGATNPSRGAAASGLSWETITRMTPEQYNARRDEIQAWMRRNPPKGF